MPKPRNPQVRRVQPDRGGSSRRIRAWQPLPPATTLESVAPIDVLITSGDDGVIASIERASKRTKHSSPRCTVKFQHIPKIEGNSSVRLWPHDTVGTAASKVLNTSDPVEITTIPKIDWHPLGEPKPYRMTVALALGLFVGLLGLLGTAQALVVTMPLGVVVGAIAYLVTRDRHPTRLVTPGDLHLDARNILEYAEARARGERLELRSDEDRRSAVDERVDEVKAIVGRLRTDVVYRIENPALFDSSIPTTEAFEAAMIEWDSNEDTSLSRLENLAAKVEVTFSVAQDHAETVGMTHLPENAQDAARRAANAARLAERASTDGERVASMAQVARILNALALHYMPEVEAPQLALEAPDESA